MIDSTSGKIQFLCCVVKQNDIWQLVLGRILHIKIQIWDGDDVDFLLQGNEIDLGLRDNAKLL